MQYQLCVYRDVCKIMRGDKGSDIEVWMWGWEVRKQRRGFQDQSPRSLKQISKNLLKTCHKQGINLYSVKNNRRAVFDSYLPIEYFLAWRKRYRHMYMLSKDWSKTGQVNNKLNAEMQTGDSKGQGQRIGERGLEWSRRCRERLNIYLIHKHEQNLNYTQLRETGGGRKV